MHNPNSVYYLSKMLYRFPLLHAQFPSTESLSIWKHCSHLQNLSSLGYILSLMSHFSVLLNRHPLKVFYAASKFFSPILSWIHSSQVYNPITLLNLFIKVTDDHHALKIKSQFSIPILVNLSVIFSSFTSESK